MKLFGGKKKKTNKTPASIVGNQSVSRISKEFRAATARYVNSAKRTGVFRNNSIYENPWFLLIGPEGSGKTSLISGSDLSFPLCYPDEKDGETVSGVHWWFGNKAVWIDMPGKLIDPLNEDTFKAVHEAFNECRFKQPVDGIICVINIEDIIQGDHDSVKAMANLLRTKIDELIGAWGFELPVFCIFSKIDKIPGFYEFFNDSSVQWSEQVLGSTLTAEQQGAPPRKVFLDEHNQLCSTLKTLRLKRLSREKKEDSRRLICSFVIQFEGVQAKIGDFFSELFKESVLDGKPIFKAFFFSSCKSFEFSGDSASETTSVPSDLSNTIVNHPLNPHRLAAVTPNQKVAAKKQVKSFFISKIFDEILPSGTQVLNRTQRSSRKELIRYWSITGLITFLFLVLMLYFLSAYTHVKRLHESTKHEITLALTNPQDKIAAFEQLEGLGDLVDKYRKFNDRGVPLSYGIGLVRTKETYSLLKKIYFNRLWNIVVGPSVSCIEYGIKKYSSGYGELSSDDYSNLYRYLKTYLSVSEAIGHDVSKIDTVTVRENIESALYQTLLNGDESSRLPQNVETIIKKNIHLYCIYLKKGEIPLVQENQQLVSSARMRLSNLPDAQVLYESMRSRLTATAPTLILENVLGGKPGNFLTCDKSVSMIYTQEGYDRFVREEINNVIKNPIKVDWVLGVTKETIGTQSYDESQMRTDLTNAYMDDVYQEWLSFLRSVSIGPLGDAVRTGMVFQKLAADGSELNLLFDNVLKFANVNVAVKEDNEALNAAKKLAGKKFAKIDKQVQTLKSLYPTEDPVDKLRNRFDPISKFAKSEGRLGGLSAYRERMGILAEAISNSASQSSGVLNVFTGKENDPYLNAWTLTQNLINEMPDDIATAIGPLIQKPLEFTGSILKGSITKELNDKWQTDVAAVFTNNFAGKYPFTYTNSEAPFDDVMEFFRPVTGTYWGFYTRNLSSYIVKDGANWKIKPVGSISIEITKDFLTSMQKADKITNIFFNSDGTLRVQKIAFLPLPQNKLPASLTLGQQEYRLLPDENRVQIMWPVKGSSEYVSLKIFVNKNYVDEVKFNSMWGLLRLFDNSRVNTLNSSSFVANWERNVQNMFMVQYGCHVQVANSAHPFGNHSFTGFECPLEIIKK